jgi:tRNA threonylcarbamoyladenosine biosynthesis protein TsaB
MKLLALSTSTPRGSAALLDGDRVLAAVAYDDLRGHAERIFAAIDEVLAAAGVARGALGALGCDIGPGSFTGVRVAVASVKGIALALGVPAAGVGSLEAMAAAAFAGPAAPGDLVVPVIDARKGELFLAAFDAPGAPPRLPPRHLPRAEVPAALDSLDALGAGGRLVIVGEVAEELPELRPHRARGPGLDFPDAAWIGRVAAGRLAAAAPPDLALLEPLYVRAPDAKPAELG